jgi:predicted RNase H-like HicB family nuclease
VTAAEARNINDYPIVIFWSDEDEASIADVTDLKNCSAYGSTPEAAFQEVRVAMAAWLESAGGLGKPIPMPTPRPTLTARAS